MPRPLRIILPGQPHHVVQRGHSRHPVFFGDGDYQTFRQSLKESAQRYGCSIHAYVLMTNHYHLLVSPPEAQALPAMIQMLGRLYVRHVNRAYDRSGTLWEGRYKTSLIDADDYLFACMRYIENNPVRAKMTARPEDYPGSSHRRTAFGEADDLVLSHRLYVALGEAPAERARAYRDLFARSGCDEETIATIRKAANGGWVIGDEAFRDKIEATIHRRLAPLPRGGDRKSAEFRDRHKKVRQG
jgi:putative transposase